MLDGHSFARGRCNTKPRQSARAVERKASPVTTASNSCPLSMVGSSAALRKPGNDSLAAPVEGGGGCPLGVGWGDADGGCAGGATVGLTAFPAPLLGLSLLRVVNLLPSLSVELGSATAWFGGELAGLASGRGAAFGYRLFLSTASRCRR